MPQNDDGKTAEDSGLPAKLGKITAVIVALTALITALVHFRDSIPWLTPVATIDIAPNPLSMAIGDRFRVVATVRDSNKNALKKTVTWSSANPALVDIDDQGIVTGKAAGDTTITASTGYINSVIPVHVRHISVAAVDVFPPAAILQVDDHLKFDATPYDSDGNSLMGRPILWAVDNPSVAAVDRSGDTLGKSAGSVKVSVNSEGKLNTATVTVNPKPAPPPVEQPPVTATTAPAPAPAPAPASTTTVAPRTSVRMGQFRTGAAFRITETAPQIASIARVSPVIASSSRAMTLAVAEKINIANGVQYGDCPASIRILIGETLISVKSDPQVVAHVPLGDQPYNLHGTLSCPQQTVAVVNGRGTVSIINGKTYRCVWRKKSPKDFEIALLPQ